MWLFKLIFLLVLIASWLPAESHASFYSPGITIDLESEEEEQEEELEEEVVV